MADYNYSIGKFGNKDALPPEDPQKIVRGSDFEEEFPSISTAVNSKLNTNNPVAPLSVVPTHQHHEHDK
jgi:hypothetical protein